MTSTNLKRNKKSSKRPTTYIYRKRMEIETFDRNKRNNNNYYI